MRVALICIGNELLIGKTVNTNLAHIAKRLFSEGFILGESREIQDGAEEIRRAFTGLLESHEIVLVTGGLGPTSDDITKQTVAQYFNCPLEYQEDIWLSIVERFQKRGITIPLINKNQALVPRGFKVLPNRYGTAPGLYFHYQEKNIFLMPGVPMEMKYLLEEQVLPLLRELYTVPKTNIVTLRTMGIAESVLAEILEDIVIPTGLNLAYLPQTGRVDIRIYGQNEGEFKILVDKIRNLINPYIWGEKENDTLPGVLLEVLQSRGMMLSLAESCTGGMVQELITGIPGSSQAFKGGVVAYQNEIKAEVLKVSTADLEKFGAVSEEVVGQMASGVRELFQTRVSGAISGIAGPGGGTAEKKVGTVCFGICIDDEFYTETRHFDGSRDSIRIKSAEYLLYMILKRLA